MKSRFKVGLKYCGSCNPQVNLPMIARHISQLAADRRDFELVPLSAGGIDAVIILCGCPRACGNKAEVRARARQSLVVAGESLDGITIPEAKLPVALEEKLRET